MNHYTTLRFSEDVYVESEFEEDDEVTNSKSVKLMEETLRDFRIFLADSGGEGKEKEKKIRNVSGVKCRMLNEKFIMNALN